MARKNNKNTSKVQQDRIVTSEANNRDMECCRPSHKRYQLNRMGKKDRIVTFETNNREMEFCRPSRNRYQLNGSGKKDRIVTIETNNREMECCRPSRKRYQPNRMGKSTFTSTCRYIKGKNASFWNPRFSPETFQGNTRTYGKKNPHHHAQQQLQKEEYVQVHQLCERAEQTNEPCDSQSQSSRRNGQQCEPQQCNAPDPGQHRKTQMQVETFRHQKKIRLHRHGVEFNSSPKRRQWRTHKTQANSNLDTRSTIDDKRPARARLQRNVHSGKRQNAQMQHRHNASNGNISESVNEDAQMTPAIQISSTALQQSITQTPRHGGLLLVKNSTGKESVKENTNMFGDASSESGTSDEIQLGNAKSIIVISNTGKPYNEPEHDVSTCTEHEYGGGDEGNEDDTTEESDHEENEEVKFSPIMISLMAESDDEFDLTETDSSNSKLSYTNKLDLKKETQNQKDSNKATEVAEKPNDSIMKLDVFGDFKLDVDNTKGSPSEIDYDALITEIDSVLESTSP